MHQENHALFFLSPLSTHRAILTKEECRHACCALRMGDDSVVYGTDGNGKIYKCRLAAQRGESIEVDIIETIPQAFLPPLVHLYIGLPEKEAFEEALVGLAALGAARIVPLVCNYCQGRWWNPWEKGLERLRRKMISGIKQAHNPWLPDLRAPQQFLEALHMVCEKAGGRTIRIVADPAGIAVGNTLQGRNPTDRIDCFIGPPGGFSPDEVHRFSMEGFQFVKVAHYRLRTELAAIALCAEIIQHFIATNVHEDRAVLPDVK